MLENSVDNVKTNSSESLTDFLSTIKTQHIELPLKTNEIAETIDIIKEESKENLPKYLSMEDVYKLLLAVETVKCKEVEAKEADLVIKNEKLQLELAKLALNGQESKISSATAAFNEKLKQLIVEKEKYKNLVKEITGKLQLKEKWGFDPESGEIKEDE